MLKPIPTDTLETVTGGVAQPTPDESGRGDALDPVKRPRFGGDGGLGPVRGPKGGPVLL